jgi:hypothetical protein
MNTRITHHIFNPVNPLIGGNGVQTLFTALLALAITFTLSGCGEHTLDGRDSFTDGRGSYEEPESSSSNEETGDEEKIYIGGEYWEKEEIEEDEEDEIIEEEVVEEEEDIYEE